MFLLKKEKREVLENYFDNIGDIMAVIGKVTTLLPAQARYSYVAKGYLNVAH